MKETELKSIIDEYVLLYINDIAMELEHSHDQWFENFGFPLFGITSKDYHEQVYFQSYLESYTRKMINGILNEMVKIEVGDEIVWPEFEYFGIYKGYTNSECEKKFAYEFINKDRKIGYRYTGFPLDEIDDLLVRGNVDSIKLVVWEGKDEDIWFEYDDKRVEVILLWDMFNELFEDMDKDEMQNMYDLFTGQISNAVKTANCMISLTTIPGFTPIYLHKNRRNMQEKLVNEVNKLTKFYVRNKNFKHVEVNSNLLIEKYGLGNYFLKKRMSDTFVGTNDYAKSFLTSEYLFNYFENNPMFDYTPIVSGYIKSIEQLLYAICTSYRNSKGVQENMGSWTMKKYRDYIDGNEDIIRKEIISAKDYILDCMESYRVECRNRLFHRDYFNKWTRVEMIRKNTIFLYVVLLAAIDSRLIEGNPKLGNEIDEEYDRMFDLLDKQTYKRFTILFDDKEYVNVEKAPRTDGIICDNKGLIKNTIIFKQFVYDNYVNIELSKENIPSEIWRVDAQGNKQELIWKKKKIHSA